MSCAQRSRERLDLRGIQEIAELERGWSEDQIVFRIDKNHRFAGINNAFDNMLAKSFQQGMSTQDVDMTLTRMRCAVNCDELAQHAARRARRFAEIHQKRHEIVN